MSSADQNKLYAGTQEEYSHLESRDEQKKALRNDPYFNALQIKFAYAVTCHKAQGGQWPVVFVDQGYLTDEMMDTEYFRWLYTAITRATDKLYLLNFSENLVRSPGEAE
jgi:exodeoxyribonuclease-5